MDLAWESVSSSYIDAVAYADGDMYVTFQDGKQFRYDGVPEAVYNNCKDAGSVGSFFHSNVKNNYPATQV